MSLRIHSYPQNKNAQKALIAAEYAGLTIEEPAFEYGVTNKTAEFKKLTPIGKVPVLETPKGSVFESNAIARYVARKAEGKNLFGNDEMEHAHVDQWIDFASNEIGKPLMTWASQICGFGAYSEEEVKKLREDAERGLAALEESLQPKTGELLLVGKDVTLADIVAFCEVVVPWQCICAPDFMKPYPTVEKYIKGLLELPEFKKVVGGVEQAAKTPTGPLAPEDNPFLKPKASSDAPEDVDEHQEAKKAKTGEA